jgi:glucosamine--fructose-6-phosphate aminotransferase (isomerizing)
MCGIIGYKGREDAISIAFTGLKRLEYRGYDSWGVAALCGGELVVHKKIGKIPQSLPGELQSKKATVALYHSRWATHGGVTDTNAHPHTDCKNSVAIAHNGIIENYEELRKALEAKGHVFKSACDSEVIAHLIEAGGSNFVEAVRKTALELQGSYAFLAIKKGADELIGVRKESPLVLGLKDGEYFLASDVPAFLEHTNTVTFIEDDEMVVLNAHPRIVNVRTGEVVARPTRKVDWSLEQAGKGEYPHFMLKEIYEQATVLKQTLRQDRAKLEQVARMVHASPRVVIVACGTSRHAGLVGRYVIAEIAGKYCEVYMASEFQYFVDKLGKDALIIAVSQSGETADVLAPVRAAKKQGCKVVAIVNVIGSSLDREADVSLYLNCGPEISVASTKAFTSQVAVFYMLAYTLAYEIDAGVKLLGELPKKIEQTIRNTEPEIKKLAKQLAKLNDVYYIARGENFAVATEGALKMKEISYVHAEGMPAGELKHGTLALVTKGTPVVAIAPKDRTFAETLSNVAEAKARGAFIIGVSDEANKAFDSWLQIPPVDYIFYPLLANIPCQLLAYYTAVERGNEVDTPRNLAKSVTVK